VSWPRVLGFLWKFVLVKVIGMFLPHRALALKFLKVTAVSFFGTVLKNGKRSGSSSRSSSSSSSSSSRSNSILVAVVVVVVVQLQTK